MGEYVLSVTAAALILGIISSVLDSKSTAGALVKLIGGLYLTFVVIQPLTRLDFDDLTAFARDFAVEGEAVSADGQELAREAMGDIIKSRTEAYILDKAGLYHAQITAEVRVSGEEVPVPASVTIRGNISPYAREALERLIATDLGIPKEGQQWIGTP